MKLSIARHAEIRARLAFEAFYSKDLAQCSECSPRPVTFAGSPSKMEGMNQIIPRFSPVLTDRGGVTAPVNVANVATDAVGESIEPSKITP